mgnify:CR=1 FL=1
MISEPDFVTLSLDLEEIETIPEYVVLATDGVWDYLSPEKILGILNLNRKMTPQTICDIIAGEARRRWVDGSRVTDEDLADIDDVSVAIVQLSVHT